MTQQPPQRHLIMGIAYQGDDDLPAAAPQLCEHLLQLNNDLEEVPEELLLHTLFILRQTIFEELLRYTLEQSRREQRARGWLRR